MKAKFSEAAYEARIEGLFRRFQSVQTAGFGAGAYKPGLAGMLRFCDALGFFGQAAAEVAEGVAEGLAEGLAADGAGAVGCAAEAEGVAGAEGVAAGIALPYPCIHVAGTNGKGSVCSMLASALAAGAGISAVPSLNNAQIRDGSCNFSSPFLESDQIRNHSIENAEPFLESGQIRNHSTENAEPFLESGQIRNASRRKVGLYTSPHLLDFRERMRVVTDDGWYLPTKEWVWNFLEEYEEVFDGSPDASATAPHLPPLSFFEITTGMAFKWFAEQGVDCAVIEVGLGGRLDSTNVILPSLCVITSIGLDHCAILGGTRAEIAAEKAGIFKPGVPAVVWGRDPETAPVFERIADSVGSPLIFADSTPDFWPIEPAATSAAGPIAGSAPDGALGLDEDLLLTGMDLQGPCQRQNLHTALASLAVLSAGQNGGPTCLLPGEAESTRPSSGSICLHPGEAESTRPSSGSICLRPGEATAEALKRTAARTGFRGRWEKFFIPLKPKADAAPSIAEVICDIGHNPPALAINFARLNEIIHRQSAARNCETAAQGIGQAASRTAALKPAVQGRFPVTIVYGVMADKDLAGIAPMMPAEARYFLVAPDSPRALPAGELLARLKTLRPDLSLTVAGSGSVAEGVATALSGSAAKAAARDSGSMAPDCLVYIGGSTFVVAEAIPLLERLGTILAKPAPGPDAVSPSTESAEPIKQNSKL